jgi:hypothetical protein
MKVVQYRSKPREDSKQRWLWRQAVVIVGQLPESEEEALAVLSYCRCLVSQGPAIAETSER